MRRHPHSAAIVLMLLAVLLFALMDAGLKLLSAKYPPLQVAALRGLSSLPFVLAWALLTVPAGSLLRIHWPLHLLRGVLGVAMMAGFVYGLRGMPLSTAYAITFVAPLLVTATEASETVAEELTLRPRKLAGTIDFKKSSQPPWVDTAWAVEVSTPVPLPGLVANPRTMPITTEMNAVIANQTSV